MPWPAPALAAALALVAFVATPRLLRRLPEPADDLEKLPYRALATRRFACATAGMVGVAGVVAFSLTPPAHWLAWTACVLPCAVAACIDARTTYLPLWLARAGWLLAAAGSALASVVAGDQWLLASAAGGAVALGGFFHLVWRLTGGLGYGDVRLMATVGAVTALESWTLPLAAALVGTFLGALVGIVLRVVRRRDGHFAYGPALLTGAFGALALAAF